MFTSSSVIASFSYGLEFLPIHILAYYPFRNHLRFPLWMVVCLNILNMSLEFLMGCYQYSVGKDIRNWDIIFAAISMAVYLLCVRAQISKLLFIYLLVVDYFLIVRGTAIFLDICLVGTNGISYRFLGAPSDLLRRYLLIALTGPFMLIFLDITRKKVLNSHAPQLWRVIWLLPALTSFVVLLFTWDVNIISVNGLSFLLARICLLIMVFIVYHMLISSLESIRLQGEAEERARNQEQIMAMQRAQYSMLRKQIEETRLARHDLRQHLNVIQRFLDNGDQASLADYIAKYGQKLSALTPRTYCSNYAVDAVVRHYSEQAMEKGILFDSHLSLPADLWIHEPDICILFGNLLENALESCAGQAGESAFVRVHARVAGERAISITVDNTCLTPPVMKNGSFVSTKHSGQGTGTMSIRNIAAQYNGIADFKYEDQVFYASVFLNPSIATSDNNICDI